MIKNKLTLFLLVLAIGIGVSFISNAQSKAEIKKTKELKKQWDKKKKEMDLSDFKDMMDNYQVLKGETDGLKRQIASMSNLVTDKKSEADRLRSEIDSLRKNPARKIREENEVDASFKPGDDTGLVFKIQVGAYEKIDLAQYNGNNKNFSIEKGEVNGITVSKYILGHFRHLLEAKNFKKYLMKIGVQKPWVVAYKDNQRMAIEEQEKYNK